MSLIPDWKKVLKKAWSLKFSFIAASLGLLEILFPAKGAFAVAAVFLNIFAVPAARILSQKEIHNAIETPADDDVKQ